MKQLKAEGIGIFLISHDIHDVFGLADRVSVMYHGRIVDTVAKARDHDRRQYADRPGQEAGGHQRRGARRARINLTSGEERRQREVQVPIQPMRLGVRGGIRARRPPPTTR